MSNNHTDDRAATLAARRSSFSQLVEDLCPSEERFQPPPFVEEPDVAEMGESPAARDDELPELPEAQPKAKPKMWARLKAWAAK